MPAHGVDDPLGSAMCYGSPSGTRGIIRMQTNLHCTGQGYKYTVDDSLQRRSALADLYNEDVVIHQSTARLVQLTSNDLVVTSSAASSLPRSQGSQ